MISSVSCWPPKAKSAGIDDLEVTQHTEGGVAGPKIGHGDGAIDATIGHLVRHELAGILERKGFDIDDACVEARGRDGGPALLDVVGARGHQQHVN